MTKKGYMKRGRLSLRAIDLTKYEELNPFSSDEEFIMEWKKENPKSIHGSVNDALNEYKKELAQFSGFPDPFLIYRAMRVEDFETYMAHFKGRQPIRYFYNRYYEGIGVYWSWEKEQAIDHWSTPKQLDEELLIFTAYVNKNDVDWRRTLIKNTGENSSEKEIRVKEGSVLKLVDITRQNGDVVKLNIKVIAKIKKIYIIKN